MTTSFLLAAAVCCCPQSSPRGCRTASGTERWCIRIPWRRVAAKCRRAIMIMIMIIILLLFMLILIILAILVIPIVFASSSWMRIFIWPIPTPTLMTGWWFGTFFLFSIIYGMSSFPLTNSYFSRWLKPPSLARMGHHLLSQQDHLVVEPLFTRDTQEVCQA